MTVEYHRDEGAIRILSTLTEQMSINTQNLANLVSEFDEKGTVSDISNFTTNDLSEGNTNLYYTDARARAANAADIAINTSNIAINAAVLAGKQATITSSTDIQCGQLTALKSDGTASVTDVASSIISNTAAISTNAAAISTNAAAITQLNTSKINSPATASADVTAYTLQSSNNNGTSTNWVNLAPEYFSLRKTSNQHGSFSGLNSSNPALVTFQTVVTKTSNIQLSSNNSTVTFLKAGVYCIGMVIGTFDSGNDPMNILLRLNGVEIGRIEASNGGSYDYGRSGSFVFPIEANDIIELRAYGNGNINGAASGLKTSMYGHRLG